MLIVLRTEDLSIVKVNQLPDEKNVGRFEWVKDTRLVFNSIRKFGRYAQPFGTGEWYGVNADGSQPPPLVFYGTRDVTWRGKQIGNERFSLRETLPRDDQNVLMTINTQERAVPARGGRPLGPGQNSYKTSGKMFLVLGSSRRPDLRVPSDCRKPQALDTIDTVSGPFSTLFRGRGVRTQPADPVGRR